MRVQSAGIDVQYSTSEQISGLVCRVVAIAKLLQCSRTLFLEHLLEQLIPAHSWRAACRQLYAQPMKRGQHPNLVTRRGAPTTVAQELHCIARSRPAVLERWLRPWRLGFVRGSTERPSMPRAHGNTLYCTFCGKSQHEVRRLVAGPRVFACNECIDLMYEIVHDEGPNAELAKAVSDTVTPSSAARKNDRSKRKALGEEGYQGRISQRRSEEDRQEPYRRPYF